jgi:DNA polymerase elongation subunit (family B)
MTTYAELNDDELIEKYKSVSNIVSSNRNAEQAIKILLNAGYGAFTNSHFKFFDIRIGTSITLTGQCIIQWCEKTFNNYFNKILKNTRC